MSDIFDMFGGGDEEVAPKPVPVPVSIDAGTGPRMQPCGHWDWFTQEEHAVALAHGHCCPGGQQKVVPNWNRLSGPYVRPVPKHVRRSADRPGGLCCDSEGFYIGEVLNDCLRRSDDRRCVFHRPKPPPPAVVEVEEPEPPKVSYKQRQLKKKG